MLPTWNHLWFVAYLFVYTLALGLILMVAPRLTGWMERRLVPILSGAWLLVLPSIAFAAYRFALLPRFPSTHALFADWYNHALFATVFLLGFLLAPADAFWTAMMRQRWLALTLAGACFVLLAALRGAMLPAISPSPWLQFYAATAYGFYQWLCIVAVFGFGRRWLTGNSPVRRYLTDAIFPYYIMHQTAIIMIAHQLQGYDLPASLEAGVGIAGTAAVCGLTYELVRRTAFLRALFGLRPLDAAAGVKAPPVASRESVGLTGKVLRRPMPDRVYLDWNATTPLRREAREAMAAAWDLGGNPSSVHAEGRQARRLVEEARAAVAGGGRRAAAKRGLYVGRNRGQRAGADAGAAARLRASGRRG